MPSPLSTFLTLGERIDIRLGEVGYRSSVQDILSEDELLALHPLDRRNLPIHIDHDELIDVVYFRPNGQFIFRAQLIGRGREESIAVVRLRALGAPRQDQMRDGYRLSIASMVGLTPLETDPSAQEEHYTVRTVDISQSGIQLEFPKMIGLGKVFRLQMNITGTDDDRLNLTLRASVSRMLPPVTGGERWRLGLRYLDASEEVRDQIARFIMVEQIARRQMCR